jgi:CheY-like chemotaxis protein
MKHTVLVVEDETELREMLRDLLQLEGFDVVVASDGGEALSLLPQIEHVCLVLLDLLMPGMNGWDFFAALKTSPTYAATPIVVTTSVPRRAPAGANAVISKPLDVERVLSTVQKYCAAA